MPIRINLLAEQQAAEEMRRRDPVKRAGMAGGLLVGIVALWSGWMQLKVMQANNSLNAAQSTWNAQEKKYKTTLENRAKLDDLEGRVSALHNLATNRFLWGPTLNALQQVVVDKVQVTRFTPEQTYTLVEGVKASTNAASGRVVPARPGTVTEEIKLLIEAKDWGRTTEQNYTRFQEAIQNHSFFKTNLATNGITLVALGAPTQDLETGRTNVGFTLQCVFQKKTR